MNVRRIIWITLGFILLPVVLAIGFLFFGIIASIILAIVLLFALLSFIFYLNRRFKYALYKFKTNAPDYEQREEAIKKTKTKGKEQEIIIEQIEEVVEKK